MAGKRTERETSAPQCASMRPPCREAQFMRSASRSRLAHGTCVSLHRGTLLDGFVSPPPPQENKALLRERRVAQRKLSLEVNGAKANIDELKLLLERKRQGQQECCGGWAQGGFFRPRSESLSPPLCRCL